ncbi:MAG TPA: sensor histidine kinase [Catalimonadaceae bacterium]|nr:sensor histidine kinase [Catalimonadaceae bacterium]
MKFRIWFSLLLIVVSFDLPAMNPERIRLEKEISVSGSDTQKLRLMTELHWICLFEDPVAAKKLAESEIQLANAKGLRKELAQGYNDLGLYHNTQSEYASALVWHRKALSIRKEIKDQAGVASSWSKIGVCLTEMAQYPEALEAQMQARRGFSELKNDIALSQTLSNICGILHWLKDFKQMKGMAKEALELARKTGDQASAATAKGYLAMVSGHEGNYAKALLLDQEASGFFEEQKDTLRWLASLNNVGFDLNMLGRQDECRKLFRKALTIARASRHTLDQILYATNLANKELESGNTMLAEQLLLEAEQLALNEQLDDHLPRIYRSFGDLYIQTHQDQKALDAYDKAEVLKDSLFSSQMAERYSQLRTRYETEQKEQEKKLLLTENQIQKDRIQRQRFLMLAGVVFCLLIAVVVWLWIQRKNLNQKRQAEAERFALQEKLAKEILDAEEKERSRIARELHDGIGQQLVAAHLNLASLESRSGEQQQLLENTRSLVEDSLKEVRSVSHTMLSNALLRSGLAGAVRDFVQKIQGAIRVHLEISGLDYRLDHTIELVLFRVIQELMGNILKHSEASDVYIQLSLENKELNLCVEDNGKGFDPASHVVEGVGLRNIRTRIAYLKGGVEIDSKPGKGCSVVIKIPM